MDLEEGQEIVSLEEEKISVTGDGYVTVVILPGTKGIVEKFENKIRVRWHMAGFDLITRYKPNKYQIL